MSRVALVTGASRGIGAAIAEALAGDAWTVVGGDITQGSWKVTDWGLSVPLDVTEEASVSEVFERVAAEVGPITGLVNNAGITHDRTLHKMTLDEWRSVLEVNLNGSFLTTRALVRALRTHRPADGRIVNVSSMSAKLGNFGQGNYAAAKAGLVALTKVSAREIARLGATANAVMPGLVDSQMTRSMDPDVLSERTEQVPLGRAARPAEIAEAVRWLASPGAGYVTGTVLEVAGGRGI